MKSGEEISSTKRQAGERPLGGPRVLGDHDTPCLTSLRGTEVKHMKRAVMGAVLALSLLVAAPALAAVSGGPGADTIYGTAGADHLSGGAGPDVIFGKAGDDVIKGGPGRDSIYGGKGFDTCYVQTQDAVSGCEVTR